MTDYIKQLESKVKDCNNTNTIFDTRKYVLLEDAKEVLNQALNIPVTKGTLSGCNDHLIVTFTSEEDGQFKRTYNTEPDLPTLSREQVEQKANLIIDALESGHEDSLAVHSTWIYHIIETQHKHTDKNK